MLVEEDGSRPCDELTDEQLQDFVSAVSIIMGREGPRQGFGVEMRGRGESLDLAGREEMVSVAMSELGHLGAEAHAKALTLKGGVEWESLDHAGREEIVSAVMGYLSLPACAFAAERGLVWYSLSPSTREGFNSEARSEYSVSASPTQLLQYVS